MSDTKPSFNGEVAVSGAPEEGRYSPVGDDYETEELLVEEETEEETEEHSSKDSQVYTVEDAVEKLGFGTFQIVLTVFSGLVWLADAMELMLLSVLSPLVKCQWNLTDVEEAMITTVVFLGFLIGGLFGGIICDRIGRKMFLLVVDIIILVFGILSAIPVSSDDSKIPGYPWLLLCRFGLGIGAGGTGQAVTYYAEFLPIKTRGIAITLLEVWWAIGSIFGALLAVLVIVVLDKTWHLYLGLAAIPLALVLPFFLIVPESARFYVVHGRTAEAEKVIKRVAWFNCKPIPKGRLVTVEEKEKLMATLPAEVDSVRWRQDDTISITRSHSAVATVSQSEEKPLLDGVEQTTDDEDAEQPTIEQKKIMKLKYALKNHLLHVLGNLFRNGMWETTSLLFIIWFGCAWLYYGIVLLTTQWLKYDKHCFTNVTDDNTTANCTQLDASDYWGITLTAVAELPGILVTLVFIELLGRKKTMSIEFLLTGLGFFLLFICTKEVVITVFLFIIRAFATGVFQAVYVYTPEVYPTSVRAAALGLHIAAARIGAMITPFVAQVLLKRSDYATISLYGGSCVVLAVLAILLPIETKGRSMKDSGAG